MEKANIFNTTFIKREGKLRPVSPNGLFKLFEDSLEEGQKVQVFMEANEDDGTNAQLAKIHVCIRKIATEMGYTFEELKYVIKKKAGLVNGETVKSFGVCSKEELGQVIEAIQEAGDMVNVDCQ